MSILCDRSIKMADLIRPFAIEQLQPASYDLTLGAQLYVGSNPVGQRVKVIESEVSVPPSRLVLAHTREIVKLPRHIAARVDGKSTLGRMGLLVHVSAGFVDPGFEGQLTLELFNLTEHPISLRLGQRVAQISFMTLDSHCERPYGSHGLGSHYQGQSGVTTPRF